MDEIIEILEKDLDPITGELVLSKTKAFALFRWLHARAMLDQEINGHILRLQEFHERFTKTSGGNNEKYTGTTSS